jgi:hypothetical protein
VGLGVGRQASVLMKKFSPPQMKEVSFPTPHTPHPTPSFQSGGLFLFILPSPQLPLCNNYWQPEIRWVHIILCAFCQKNFFFAIKLHTKKIIVVGEID